MGWLGDRWRSLSGGIDRFFAFRAFGRTAQKLIQRHRTYLKAGLVVLGFIATVWVLWFVVSPISRTFVEFRRIHPIAGWVFLGLTSIAAAWAGAVVWRLVRATRRGSLTAREESEGAGDRELTDGTGADGSAADPRRLLPPVRTPSLELVDLLQPGARLLLEDLGCAAEPEVYRQLAQRLEDSPPGGPEEDWTLERATALIQAGEVEGGLELLEPLLAVPEGDRVNRDARILDLATRLEYGLEADLQSEPHTAPVTAPPLPVDTAAGHESPLPAGAAGRTAECDRQADTSRSTPFAADTDAIAAPTDPTERDDSAPSVEAAEHGVACADREAASLSVPPQVEKAASAVEREEVATLGSKPLPPVATTVAIQPDLKETAGTTPAAREVESGAGAAVAACSDPAECDGELVPEETADPGADTDGGETTPLSSTVGEVEENAGFDFGADGEVEVGLGSEPLPFDVPQVGGIALEQAKKLEEMLAEADRLRNAGQVSRAEMVLNQLVRRAPGTRYAKDARMRLLGDSLFREGGDQGT